MQSLNPNFPRGIEIVTGAVIENTNGEILMVKSPKWSNKWCMPGGHLDPGETISQAVLREAKEETGLKLKPVKIVSFGELINPADFYRPAHFIYFDLWCLLEGDQEIKLDGIELGEFKWVTSEEALKMDLANSYDKTIRDYLEQRNKK